MLILIIEDDKGLAELLEENLEELGYNSYWADTFEKAEEYLSKDTPGLMIVDYLVYHTNALDWIEEMKNKQVSLPPFIISTGHGDERTAVDFMKLGARDYIIKDNLFFERLPEVIKRVYKQIENEEKLKQAEEALKENQQRLQSVLQAQKEMICRYKPDTTLTYVNDAYYKVFGGKHNHDLIGKKWIDFVRDDHKESIKKHLDKLKKGSKNTIKYEHDSDMPDGTKKWFEWSDYVIKDNNGKIIEFQSVGHDITDRKEKERLEKEMEIAKNTLEFKQNFLASMSHEIRTPLTGIMGIAELLDKTVLNNTQKDFVNTLKQASENLREIIDQVLDYSKIEAGKLKLKKQEFKVENIISKSNNFFKGICRKDIKFISELDNSLPDIIKADDKRIFQIINNLLINAVKFTEEGTIKLRVLNDKFINDKELFIKVEISDTGIGIRPERQKTVFSPFSQIHEIDTEHYKGVGLGLAISKEIVELHGGNIDLESTPGKGTSVWFTFKAETPELSNQRNTKYKRKENKSSPKNLKILFVEDKVVTQKIVSLQLKEMGHEVMQALNGKVALECYKPGEFDLILMDIQMPVMDGITATKKLKEKYHKTPPIVGLSANAFEGDREKYMKLGMDEYLTKPLQNEDLNKLLKKLF